MTNILFVHNALQRFVALDLTLLQEEYQVEEWVESSPRRLNPWAIWQAVCRHDLIFGWFASWHTFLPVLFAKLQGKRSILIVGGYDVANVPTAQYGSQRGGFRKWLATVILKLATHLVPFSQSAKAEILHNTPVSASKITSIYLGVPDFAVNLDTPRQPIILTVSGVRPSNLWRKGLLPFVQTAALLPEYKFVVAGKWYDASIETLRQHAASNVEFTGFIDDETLYSLYREASVYVQASLHEGFGLSLVEAMLGGCIPVVTRVGSLPEVVGKTGIYTPSNQPEAIHSAIVEALALDETVRHTVRQRILTEFPPEKRQSAIYTLIGRIMTK